MRNETTGRLLASQIKGITMSCTFCGVDFVPKSGAKGGHCSLKCWHKSKIKTKIEEYPEHYKCTKCLADLGLGTAVTSRLTRIDKSGIAKFWNRCGIKAKKPECGSWRIYVSKSNQSKSSWWGGDEIARYWMSEYNPKFPDWWSVYAKDRQNKLAIEYQRAMHHSLPKEHPWRLKKVCRTRIYHAIKRGNAGVKPRLAKRTTQLIGCSMEYLREYIESKFQRGMTWENHGSGWHIDHIVPCAAFDFTQPDQILQCFHYTNLQPLWAHENLSKSDRIITTQMNLRI
jgi:hypothetical protein